MQVVALYPGSCYTPLQYRQIPGYPKIDRDNSYLIGMVISTPLSAMLGQRTYLCLPGNSSCGFCLLPSNILLSIASLTPHS